MNIVRCELCDKPGDNPRTIEALRVHKYTPKHIANQKLAEATSKVKDGKILGKWYYNTLTQINCRSDKDLEGPTHGLGGETDSYSILKVKE